MLRLLENLDRLNNKNTCGLDREFCFPFARTSDIIMYKKLPPGEWTIYSMSVYDKYFSTLLGVFYRNPIDQVSNFFSFIIGIDSNGDNFLVIRQTMPMYNYNGVTPELTCYSLGFTMVDGDANEFTFGSEPVCSIAKYTMKHYVFASTDITQVDQFEVFIFCDGETVATAYHYDDLPLGWWIDYTGPLIDLFIPEGCTVAAAFFAGEEVQFEMVLQEFGAESCKSYVRLSGSGKFNYDCKGRYFGGLKDPQIVESNRTMELLVDPDSDPRLDITRMPINIMGGILKDLGNKITTKKFRGGCYIPTTETINRYSVKSLCPVPAWFVQEVNAIAGLQSLILEGTDPLADDDDNLIEVMQSDEYNWKERDNAKTFWPKLYFETCICNLNFNC